MLCEVSALWRDRGRVSVLVAREQGDGRLTVGRFVVDRWCLGLLSASVSVDVDEATLVRVRDEIRAEDPLVACAPELAAALVYGSIDFAARIGFSPHPAWAIARHLLPPNASTAAHAEEVEFGLFGKPCYVAGAGDDEQVLAHLADLGPDAFHVLLPG
jgi:hypothetical protein